MLGYGVTAYVCYPGDHPVSLAPTGPLFAALVRVRHRRAGGCAPPAAGSPGRSWQRRAQARRNRFLALWGLMSSLWFFAAILFNAIASVTVPPCVS